MAKVKVTLHPITKEITLVLRQLRKIRSKVSRRDLQEIKPRIRGLEVALKKVKKICLPWGHSRVFDWGGKK